jgi:CHAT domain-containing protein/tetratricopeptide (TPR) repeat protein
MAIYAARQKTRLIKVASLPSQSKQLPRNLPIKAIKMFLSSNTTKTTNFTLTTALAAVLVISAAPVKLFAQESAPSATETRHIPTVIVTMTDEEKQEYDALIETGNDTIRVGQWDTSLIIWNKILGIEEKSFGPDNPVITSTIANLANAYERLGKHSEAEPLLRRALLVHERTSGPEHPMTLKTITNLAINLRNQNRAEEAEPLLRSVLVINEKLLGPEHAETAASLNSLAINLDAQLQAKTAEPLYRRALAIREKVFGSDNTDTATSFNNLAANLGSQGRVIEAEPLYRRALAIYEKTVGPNDVRTTSGLNNLAVNLNKQGRYKDAELLYRRTLAINEKVRGAEHPDTAASLDGLAQVMGNQGRAKDAEPLLRRALAIREKVFGPEHSSTAGVLLSLALNLNDQGRVKDAESLYRRGLAIYEKTFGAEHPLTATSLSNVASNLREQGRAIEAEQLFRRALVINEKILGPDHPYTAITLDNLAGSLNAQDRFKEAEPLHRRALAIREKIHGLEHPDTALTYNNLAFNVDSQGRTKEAEQLYRRALAIREKILGPDHPAVAVSLNNLASNLKTQGRSSDALPLLRRSLKIFEKIAGPGHPNTANTAENLGSLELQLSPSDALVSSRQALSIRRALAEREGGGATESAQALLSRATSNAGLLFVRSALSVDKAGGGSAALTAESFLAAQFIKATSSGRALARGTALASLDARGQKLARVWESALTARADLDRRFTAIAGFSSADSAAKRAQLGQDQLQLDSEVKRAEDQLRVAYPAYFNLIAPGPVELAELQTSVSGRQALLGANEALILITPGDDRFSLSERRGIVFAVTREGVAWNEIGAEPETLARDIAALRQLLDSGGSTRAPGSGDTQTGAQLGYDRATARRVYNALFGSPKIAKLIAGKSEWLINPKGALLSLPFAALVAGDYSGDDADAAALRSTPWLGMTKALSVIPEISSLKALRGLVRPERATQTPFFGIGDPEFGRGASSAAPASVVAAAPDGGAPGQVRSYFRGANADIDAISKLSPLPGTRGEIASLAKSLNAMAGSTLLGNDATEANLRKRSNDGSLGRARVVAFATHGLIAGDLDNSLAQPALALAPPSPSDGPVTEANDGLLTASEAATLKLGADWVILSACNTASGNSNGAEGLSGLARSFFYAGADTLLVSHWRVRDDAAARLTTRAVEISQSPGPQKLSRAAALQKSMRELMNDPSQDRSGAAFAHPSMWAPFTIIGVER